MTSQVEKYISQLSVVEKKILEIAKDHLETSFSIKESIGYKEWLSAQTPTPISNKHS